MKERILAGWNFQRVIYVLIGVSIMVQSVAQHEWLGVLPGGYFASMGIFAFGCAAGNCFEGTCYTETETNSLANKEVENKA
jgi:hypothetical protein